MARRRNAPRWAMVDVTPETDPVILADPGYASHYCSKSETVAEQFVRARPSKMQVEVHLMSPQRGGKYDDLSITEIRLEHEYVWSACDLRASYARTPGRLLRPRHDCTTRRWRSRVDAQRHCLGSPSANGAIGFG